MSSYNTKKIYLVDIYLIGHFFIWDRNINYLYFFSVFLWYQFGYEELLLIIHTFLSAKTDLSLNFSLKNWQYILIFSCY